MKRKQFILLALLIPALIFGQSKWTKNWNDLGHAYINSTLETASTSSAFSNVDTSAIKFWMAVGGDEWNITQYNAAGVTTAELDTAGRWFMSYIKLGTSTTNGYVLTTDASGNGTWQASPAVLDHGGLTGLADDDHVQYLLADGTRGLSADWDVGAHSITALNLILSGDLAVNGDDITSDGDLTITPAGGDLILEATTDHSGNYAVDMQNITDLGGSGASYRFDGVDDYITVPDNADLDFGSNSFSISTNILVNAENVKIVDKYIGTTGYFLFISSTGTLRPRIGDGVNSVVASAETNISDGVWHHVVWVVDRNNDEWYVYVDGILDDTVNISTVTGSVSSGSDLVIGANTSTITENFDGQISKIQLFSTALTATEVKALYSGAGTEFKYVGASQTALIEDDCVDDDTGDWGVEDCTVAFDTDHYTVSYSAATQYFYQDNAFTAIPSGKLVELIYYLKSSDGVLVNAYYGNTHNVNATLIGSHTGTGSWVKHTDTVFITDGTEDSFTFYTTMTVGQSYDIKGIIFKHIGNVAKYRDKDATPSTWYDASGNGNDGTVTGATLINSQEVISLNGGIVEIKEITTPAPTSGYGKLYTKTDNVLYFQDGAGNEQIMTAGSSDYGEMGNANNSTATEVLAEADQWYACYHANINIGLATGWTYQDGFAGEIASTSTGAGSVVTITDVGHGLTAGDYITMNGMSDVSYNGIYEVQTAPTVDTFTITETNTEASETGFWQMGSYLQCATTGVYRGVWTADVTQSGNNARTTHIAPFLNITESIKACSHVYLENSNDISQPHGNGLMPFTAGDRIWFGVTTSTAQTISFLVRNVSIGK